MVGDAYPSEEQFVKSVIALAEKPKPRRVQVWKGYDGDERKKDYVGTFEEWITSDDPGLPCYVIVIKPDGFPDFPEARLVQFLDPDHGGE